MCGIDVGGPWGKVSFHLNILLKDSAKSYVANPVYSKVIWATETVHVKRGRVKVCEGEVFLMRDYLKQTVRNECQP